jgi:hypothetical protein
VKRAFGDFGTIVPAALGVSIDVSGVGIVGAATMSGIGFTVATTPGPDVSDFSFKTFRAGRPSFPPVTFTGMHGTPAQVTALDAWVHATMQGQDARRSVVIRVSGLDGSTRLSLTLVNCVIIGSQAYDFAPSSDPLRVYGELTLQPERIQVDALVFKSAVAGVARSGALLAAAGDPGLASALASGEVGRAAETNTDGGIKSMLVNVQRPTAFTLTPQSIRGGAVRAELQLINDDPDNREVTISKRWIDPVVLSRIIHGNSTQVKAWIADTLASRDVLPSLETVGFDVTQTRVAALTYTDIFLTSVTLIGPESAANFTTIDLTFQPNGVASQ